MASQGTTVLSEGEGHIVAEYLSMRTRSRMTCHDINSIWFVHGLRGDALGTWTKGLSQTLPVTNRNANSVHLRIGEKCWPRDLLKADVRNARIFTWGYDSSVLNPVKSSSQASIFGHLENLLYDIARTRPTDEEVRTRLKLAVEFLGLKVSCDRRVVRSSSLVTVSEVW